MPESESHKRAKNKAPGDNEVRLLSGKILDSATDKTATEIERSPSPDRLDKAVERLDESGRDRKILQVPQQNMPKAIEAMEKIGVKGTVKNLRGTKSKSVKP